MPKIAEIREIDGEVWARIGKAGEFPDGVTLWTAEEVINHYDDAFKDGVSEAEGIADSLADNGVTE